MAGELSGEAAIRPGNQVLAGVEDTLTGQRFFARNAPTAPEELYPALSEELEPYRQLIEASPELERYGPPGAHAEINALNQALWARDPSGTLLTTADLADFDMVSVWLGKSGPQLMSRCPNCWFLTPNVNYLGPLVKP
ncbi:MAG TPA: hypothetical protein VFB38_21330 [Chthonomonadaceae bacterium]|nr:hypothetical protein [Chthonomonadaceae bacterium]HZT40953.1 hypothetical protein [Chthonomonadaceae bacterium]